MKIICRPTITYAKKNIDKDLLLLSYAGNHRNVEELLS
jgi:hypothetical protein